MAKNQKPEDPNQSDLLHVESKPSGLADIDATVLKLTELCRENFHGKFTVHIQDGHCLRCFVEESTVLPSRKKPR